MTNLITIKQIFDKDKFKEALREVYLLKITDDFLNEIANKAIERDIDDKHLMFVALNESDGIIGGLIVELIDKPQFKITRFFGSAPRISAALLEYVLPDMYNKGYDSVIDITTTSSRAKLFSRIVNRINASQSMNIELEFNLIN